MSTAYYNGEFCDFKDMKIPLTDRSIFFGDGIYDAAIGANGKIYLENEHIERFYGNSERLNIPLKKKRSELSMLLREIAENSGFENYFIYFQLSRYSEERAHSYKETDKSNLLITVSELTIPSADSEVRLITAPDIRYDMCDIKTVNLLPAVLASKRASDKGACEAVLCRGETVTECAHSNVAIVLDGILYTHPLSNRILPGITRKRMLEKCKELGIKFEEKAFTKDALFYADEVLITSTSKLIRRAFEIDGISLKNKNKSVGDKLIKTLFEDFSHCCRR